MGQEFSDSQLHSSCKYTALLQRKKLSPRFQLQGKTTGTQNSDTTLENTLQVFPPPPFPTNHSKLVKLTHLRQTQLKIIDEARTQ